MNDEEIEALKTKASSIQALFIVLCNLEIKRTNFQIERIFSLEQIMPDNITESFSIYSDYFGTIYVYSHQDFHAMQSFVKLLRDIKNRCDEKMTTYKIVRRK